MRELRLRLRSGGRGSVERNPAGDGVRRPAPGVGLPDVLRGKITVRRTGVAPGSPDAHEAVAAHLRRRHGNGDLRPRGVHQHLLRRAVSYEPETDPTDPPRLRGSRG